VALTAASAERAHVAGWLDGFGLAATVTHGGRPVFQIYTRAAGSAVTLAAEEFDPQFDREFARLATLRYRAVWEDDLALVHPASATR
jgi:hypothetical protein